MSYCIRMVLNVCSYFSSKTTHFYFFDLLKDKINFLQSESKKAKWLFILQKKCLHQRFELFWKSLFYLSITNQTIWKLNSKYERKLISVTNLTNRKKFQAIIFVISCIGYFFLPDQKLSSFACNELLLLVHSSSLQFFNLFLLWNLIKFQWLQSRSLSKILNGGECFYLKDERER